MSQKEQREVERNHLLIPTIGRLKVLSNRELSVLFEASVLDAKGEIQGLNSCFGIGVALETGEQHPRRITTYTQLDDAASLIEATMESLSDIASSMRHISREMEGRDRIDG